VNTNKLKTYAQAARREFIKAVTERAHYYGLKEDSIDPCEVKGDFAIINGSAFPKQVDDQRRKLEEQIKEKGFDQVMEEVAYTWFNRFAATRYMELHGFLSHGYRVLSHPEGSSIPEILEKAQHVELVGLDKEEVVKLKMDGTKDEELYSKLLISECNELSKAIPFLFERVQDYTELLLPDNLLHSDSIIRKLVNEIDEVEWQEVEIIGWLYQFYISEKKDEVIGKVVKSEDIPAATQLFTPNWIVKYLVQNSLGAQWMRTYPDSTIKSKMDYYIEPAKQTDEVNAKVKEITPDTLNPEELTLLDPACGSGHILVEAYDLLKEIYLARGYRKRDIPEFILTKNLYGLEIDDRAAQLAGFALMMKARADDRSIFDRNIQPNIVSIQESSGIKAENEFIDLVNLFEQAKTYGSLIRVPEDLKDKLPELRKKIEEGKKGLNKQDLWTGSQYYERLLSLVDQAEIISRKYDVVVANPPYMGGKGMNAMLKEFANTQYPTTKSDLFAMFIERGFELAKQDKGNNSMVTMQSWMFLSSFEECRELWIHTKTITTMTHLGSHAFSTISGEVVTVTAFTFLNNHIGRYKPFFLRLIEGSEEEKRQGIINKLNAFSHTVQDDFKKIPGSPIAYWVSEGARMVFGLGELLGNVAMPRKGMVTADNPRFIRYWFEVSQGKISFVSNSREQAKASNAKWFPCQKGGYNRKWAGNTEHVVNWENDGYELLNMKDEGYKVGSTNHNLEYIFKPAIIWTKITSSDIGFRYSSFGFLYHDASSLCPVEHKMYEKKILGLLNSPVSRFLLEALNPTTNLNPGNLCTIPYVDLAIPDTSIDYMIKIAKFDWDSFENSWDFIVFPLLSDVLKGATVKDSYLNWEIQCNENIISVKQLEEENNRLFIKAYGLQDELSSDVPDGQITLARADKEVDLKRLISYSVGCMMGRYSLDQKGIVYAHAGNDGFDHNKYKTFPADDDGIVPITDHEWFVDDAAFRFFRFIETAWNKDTLEDNLLFVADAIGRKTNESSRDAIRRYFVNGFFKDHLKTYKKRPIYWLITSGKEKAFQTLVYLHRYNEGTLSRMRTEYVLPLQSKMATRMEHLEKDKDHATSTSAANKVQKEIGRLRKQKEELLKFDEDLHHYADKKISLDLDDGVKVNYGKFGDLLAEVKTITGKK
jgi:type II restriction/modification system DNA methylase subunit YeeA